MLFIGGCTFDDRIRFISIWPSDNHLVCANNLFFFLIAECIFFTSQQSELWHSLSLSVGMWTWKMFQYFSERRKSPWGASFAQKHASVFLVIHQRISLWLRFVDQRFISACVLEQQRLQMHSQRRYIPSSQIMSFISIISKHTHSLKFGETFKVLHKCVDHAKWSRFAINK